jgi:undecaprenyl-diphosphatase
MSVPYGFTSFDRVVFHLINDTWSHPTLDAIMPVITDIHKVPWFAFGVAPASLGLWWWKQRARALRIMVVAVIAMGVCDLISYRVIKPWVARPRPVHAGIGAIQRSPVGGKFGFPSNHSINTAAAASVLSVAYPPVSFAFWTGAALVAYSRVYCGAHYPGDVVAGLLLGGLLSWPWAVLMLGSIGSGGSKKKRR